MSYLAGPEPLATFISAWGRRYGLLGTTSVAASGTFETASLAAYFPIFLPSLAVARRLWWVNGATVSATYNVDVGIYADAGYKPGTRLTSAGSTAQGTASQVQFVDVTDTVLPAGRYWLAIACSSASATFFRSPVQSSSEDAVFGFIQTNALPLPATATPAERISTQVYHFGFATTASP